MVLRWWLSICAVTWLAGWAKGQSVDGFNPNVNYWVTALAEQPDGKVVFGGDFHSVGGIGRNCLARVDANGNLDAAFNPNASDTVYSLAIQPDGKLLVGGDFTMLGTSTRYAIGRLNSNGSVDTGFNPTIFVPPPLYTSAASVEAIVLQPDGKILLGGWRSINGSPQQGYVARLNANGTVDSSFATGGVSGGKVRTLSLQPDGKILVGGSFTTVASQSRKCLARLNTNGSLDLGFNPGLTAVPGNGPFALALAVQADGKVLVGGAFSSIAGQTRTNLARLNSDGTCDTAFEALFGGGPYAVYSVALQADGKILVGGIFSSMGGGTGHKNLGRLNSNGSIDESFTATANLDVYGLALQADGRLVVGGFFSSLGGQPRNYLGRVTPTEPPRESLTCAGWAIQWLRGGSGPEVFQTTFETSTNGIDWELAGAWTRIPGGWEATPGGAQAPHWVPGASIRARGYTAGGGYNGSSGLVETRGRIVPQILQNEELGFNGGGSFAFHVTGLANAGVVIEASTNLRDWMPVQTNHVDEVGDWWFQDLGAAAWDKRFYRARFE